MVYGTMMGTTIWVNTNIEIINLTIIVVEVVIKLIGEIEVEFIYLSLLCQEK